MGSGRRQPPTDTAAAAVTPTTETPAVQEARAEQIRRKARSRGYRSTILNSMSSSPDSPTGYTQPGTQTTLGV